MIGRRGRPAGVAKVLLLAAVAMIWSDVEAAAQARGVIIQIPDDVAPGSQRPAPAPPAAVPPVVPVPTDGAAKSACRGAACSAPDAWHILNTSNRSCLVLSKNDLKGGKDVHKLSTLLPEPLFIVASGACP